MVRPDDKPATLLSAYENANRLAWEHGIWPFGRPVFISACIDAAEALDRIVAEHRGMRHHPRE